MNLRQLDALDKLVYLLYCPLKVEVKEEDIEPRKAMWRRMLAEYKKRKKDGIG